MGKRKKKDNAIISKGAHAYLSYCVNDEQCRNKCLNVNRNKKCTRETMWMETRAFCIKLKDIIQINP